MASISTPFNIGMQGPWADVYLLFAQTSLGVLLICLFVRTVLGASPFFLARTRCYEIPPLRLAFHSLHIVLKLVLAGAAWITIQHAWVYFETKNDTHGVVALTAGGAGLLTLLLCKAVFICLIRIADNPPPAVTVRNVETSEGINSFYLENLGREQFPQMLAYGHTGGLWVRSILMLAGFACFIFVIMAATEWGEENGLYAFGIDAVKKVKAIVPPVTTQWAIATGISATLGLILVLFTNRTYTLLRFPTSLLAGGALAGTVWACAAILGSTDEHLGITAGGFGLAFAIRWAKDLSRASWFTRVRNVSVPIGKRIALAFPDLNTLKSRSDCRLTALNEGELCERISHGCRNAEEAGILVTRNFGRFLSLLHIEYEYFAAAMLRYLTVRRYVTSFGGGGTTRWLQHPIVPMWNETLFPVHPPAGFQNWLDPLGLGSQWDIVCICPTCGGRGTVTRTESYTETQNGQSVTRYREVTETCQGCGGCCRVVYHQTLNTQWQRLLPTTTAPHVHISDFMEDAEERTYYRIPLVEDRTPLKMKPIHDGIGPDLEAKLSKVVPALSKDLPDFSNSVEKLHDGTIYRADFQVTGYWVLKIGFRWLPGKVGWFFGRRPEFYFPALPLGWGTVGTVLFVLPFLTMTVLLAGMAAIKWLNLVLPTIQ